MTYEAFWTKIIISEKEKEQSKHFLKYRGVGSHENVREFLQSLTGEVVTYTAIATAFRYDKRIRRILYKYIGFLEETIRAYIANKYSDNINSLKCIKKVLASLADGKSLFDSLSGLTFGELKKQVNALPDEDKKQIFPCHKGTAKCLEKDLTAVVVLRNEVSHNRFLLDCKRLSKCSVGDKNNSLWANIINLKNLLPRYLHENYKSEINDAKKQAENKYKEQVAWNLLPNIIISLT